MNSSQSPTKLQVTLLDLNTLLIQNQDYHFTDEIQSKGINIKSLYYELLIKDLGEINDCIKYEYLPTVTLSVTKQTYDFTFQDLQLNLKSFKLSKSRLYSIRSEIRERLFGSSIAIKQSQSLYYSPQHGVINIEKLKTLRREQTRKPFSRSEAEAMEHCKKRISENGLQGVLTGKDIKEFTFSSRHFRDLNRFKDQNSKFCKPCDSPRRKRVLYCAEVKGFFDGKYESRGIAKGRQDQGNPFLKNGWFMGPIYVWDRNYTGLFK